MSQELIQLRWFDYRQNNSGGNFVHDANRGIGNHVLIQAANAAEANSKAEEIGLYFGGEGDCPCCGDRWYELWMDEGDLEPNIYGDIVEPCSAAQAEMGMWNLPSYMHFYDGSFSPVKNKVV